MSIKKLLARLDEFFDQSKKKQKKKSDNLAKIIEALELKRAKIKKELKAESKIITNNKQTYNLCKEFKAITKMIKKAKKQERHLCDEK